MKILIDYWYVIFAIMALLAIAAVAVARFSRLPRAEQMENVRQWLLGAVTVAEKERHRQAETSAGLRRLSDQIPLACPRYPLRAIFWPGR